MNASGALLDTGPLVALLSRNDADHDLAKKLFSETAKPLHTCEAVLSEACLLLKAIHRKAPAEVIKLAEKGVYTVSLSLPDHWPNIASLLAKHEDRPISLAHACLIRCADVLNEPRILTFDSDFRIYRWGRNRKFDLLGL